MNTLKRPCANCLHQHSRAPAFCGWFCALRWHWRHKHTGLK